MSRSMNTVSLAALAAIALAPAAQAQVAWTATTAPAQATIKGGPWTISTGKLANPASATGYCTNNVENVFPTTSQTLMQPYYFPFITGRGQTLQGYFDYRPKNVNEKLVAASSSDGGQTWTYQQQALELTAACPDPTDVANNNKTFGNDAGLGHPHVLSFGGANFLYLLDRRPTHVDSDGLVVHRLYPAAGLPLGSNKLNATAQFTPAGAALVAQWNFSTLATAVNNTPAASVALTTATAKSLGMTNSYTYPSKQDGTGGTQTSSTTADDIEAASPGNSDTTSPVQLQKDWRIRGNKNATSPAAGNGWNTAAPQYTQGAEFDVATTGYSNIVFQYDWFVTGQGVRNLQAQYTTDGTSWTNAGTLQVTPDGGGYVEAITIDFAALGITTVANNSKFGVRLVSAYDPTYSGAGAPAYTGASLTNGQPVKYNNVSGNWHFDNVKVYSKPLSTTVVAADFDIKTTGLLNPDGIVAVVPGSYPHQVLYVRKVLGSDYSFAANQICGFAGRSGSINHDVDTIRLAQTLDGVTFTDLGDTALTDPATISPTGIRYAAPNGSLVKLGTATDTGGHAYNKYGLFFGAGNCLDGDSDGFHAIVYAENTDATLLHWTMVNGINNPIVSTAPVTYNGTVYSPASTVLGQGSGTSTATNGWFGGRVYNPMAMWKDSSHINLIFDGYNATYGNSDLTNYRSIGQAVLSSGSTVLP